MTTLSPGIQDAIRMLVDRIPRTDSPEVAADLIRIKAHGLAPQDAASAVRYAYAYQTQRKVNP